MNWFYAENDQPRGPFDDDAWSALIAAGTIRPETLVWRDGLEHWTRFAQVASLPSAPVVLPPVLVSPVETVPETPEEFAARIAEKDYRVDIASCLGRSWDLLRAHLWALVGATLVIYAIIFGGSNLPVIGIAMPLAFNGVFMGGLFAFFLKTMRGENPEFSELFGGFLSGVFGQLALKTLVSTIVMIACLSPGMIALVVTGAVRPSGAVNPETLDSAASLASLGLLLIGAIPACYYGFCWSFAVPLIIDRRMKFWPAMKLSHDKVLQHPWRVSVLLIAAGLAAGLGVFGLCIGIVFTLPLYVGALAWLYADVFDEPAA